MLRPLDDGTIDDNDHEDLFLHEVATGTTRLMTYRAGTAHSADAQSFSPIFSPDGRYIAFTSLASDLTSAPPHVDGPRSVLNTFVYDMETEQISLVSVNVEGTGSANEYCANPYQFSGDGSRLLFRSGATNLVDDVVDATSANDVFVRDFTTGTTTLVSVDADGVAAGSVQNRHAIGWGLSPDGRYVVFQTAAPNLVPEDQNDGTDVFLRDLELGETIALTTDGQACCPRMSTSGRYVIYSSRVDGATEGDGVHAVFRYDIRRGRTQLITRRRGTKNTPSSFGAHNPRISANGRYIAFFSRADDLVAGKKNTLEEVFFHDARRRKTRVLTRVAKGLEADPEEHGYGSLTLSANGRYVAFEADTDDLDASDTNGRPDVYVMRTR